MFVALTAGIRRALGWGVAALAAAECNFVHEHPVTKPRPILLLHLVPISQNCACGTLHQAKRLLPLWLWGDSQSHPNFIFGMQPLLGRLMEHLTRCPKPGTASRSLTSCVLSARHPWTPSRSICHLVPYLWAPAWDLSTDNSQRLVVSELFFGIS